MGLWAKLELTFGFFAVAAPAVVFAGISKGGFGSGAAFAAASILALVVEPGVALAVMLPMLIDVATLKSCWGKWNWRASLLMILGGLPGVALGALLYARADADVFGVLIGTISIGFVLWRIAQERGWVRTAATALPDWAGAFAGLVAGFTSFVSHAGGPPAAVYLLSARPTKTECQASTALIFWAINIAKFVPYAAFGMFTAQTGLANLVLAPFA